MAQHSLVVFNKAIMKHEARLPLHPLVRGVLAHLGLLPRQLNPNAYKILARMHILKRMLFEVDLAVEEVYCWCRIKTNAVIRAFRL